MAFENMKQAREAAANTASRQRTAFDDLWKYEMSLLPGEKAIVRFLGGPGEPHSFYKHTLSNAGNGFEWLPCSGNANPATGTMGRCLLCEAAQQNGPRARGQQSNSLVKGRSAVAAFTVYSTRRCLVVPKTRTDGTSYTVKEPLHLNAMGQHISRQQVAPGVWQIVAHPGGVDPRTNQFQIAEEGLKVWLGGLHPKANNGDRITALDGKLSSLCHCGRTVGQGLNALPATVSIAAYTCSSCGSPVAYDPNTANPVVCGACHSAGTPDENLNCSAACGNARRGGLDSCYVEIQRQGAGTDTAYDFTPRPFSPPEAEHQAVMYRSENGRRVINGLPLPSFFVTDLNAQFQALQARGITPRIPYQPVAVTPAGAPPAGGFSGFSNQTPQTPNAAPRPVW